MAARGAVAKEQITQKILEMFDGAFKYEKEIRIPVEENGETIQIKVTLTAAKNNVEFGGDTALPGETKPMTTITGNVVKDTPKDLVEPTEEEKENVAKLVATLF